LDVKQTLLGLVHWNALSPALTKRVGRFRLAGQRARVLFALDAPPAFPFARDIPDARAGPIHVVESMEAFPRRMMCGAPA